MLKTVGTPEAKALGIDEMVWFDALLLIDRTDHVI